MRATAFLVALSLILIVPGCLESTPKTAKGPETPIDPKANWTVPATPKIGAAVFLQNMSAFVKTYPHRAENVATHLGARDYLAKQFADAGLVVWRQSFTNEIKQENVCGAQIGVGVPDEWVVVGGHYDTTTDDAIVLGLAGQAALAPGAKVSEGAYDDGSGTWITVELAKAFAKIPTYYSVLYCGFDGEERGLQGSRVVAGAMKPNSTEFPFPYNATRAMLDFDMFGICYPVRAPIGFTHSSKRLGVEVDAVRKKLGVPDDMWRARLSRTGGGSDFAHWINKVPTVFFISDMGSLGVPTPVPQDKTPGTPAGAYPWWHWMDTMETMSAMAGGPDMLRAGFQTALDLGAATLTTMASRPDIELEMDA